MKFSGNLPIANRLTVGKDVHSAMHHQIFKLYYLQIQINKQAKK